MKATLVILASLLFAAGPVLADTVTMRDGVTRVGVIESRNDKELRLRIDNDGISSTLVLPMSQIAHIVIGGPSGTPAATSASAITATKPASGSSPSAASAAPPSAVRPPTDAELAAFASRGFLEEMAASSLGHGLDDPGRLPAAEHELWDRAGSADAAGKTGETLDALRLLEAAMRGLPDGLSRIDAVSRRVRGEGFGTWMARVHWDMVSDKYATGAFDLADVREVERPVLIGLMKGKMGAALEPLKTYFPPLDDKTGQPMPFKPAQLSGITLANAMEVKEKAQLAAALLLGQLKLDPQMSSLDRTFLSGQLLNVNRVLSRARSLEPQARAAIARQQQQERAAAEKAQRDAANAARKTAAPH
jgi:hypothetical protein